MLRSDNSLEIVQQPYRARMCGFGDKVRECCAFLCAFLLAPAEPFQGYPELI